MFRNSESEIFQIEMHIYIKDFTQEVYYVIIEIYVFLVFVCFVFEKVSSCILGLSRMHYVAYVGLKLTITRVEITVLI